MTVEEFNEKYNDYLEPGHYGLDIGIPEVVDYLDKEFEELIKIPGFMYSQIKTKFSFARFYCDNVPMEKIYEIESYIEEVLKRVWKNI